MMIKSMFQISHIKVKVVVHYNRIHRCDLIHGFTLKLRHFCFGLLTLCIFKDEGKISKFMPLPSVYKLQPKILSYAFMGGTVYKYTT